MAGIDLGAFTLDKPFARGGMGQVWRAVHRRQGQPVAIKVMTAWQFKKEGNAAAFRNEVRAVAAMNHPGVVLVFDYGEVDDAAHVASGGSLMVGCPWLAMELATTGSLKEIGALRWTDVHSVLVSLLDALAHAHARGVIHRDLKPGNVLISGPGDLRPGVKLTDFGLAHALESTLEEASVTGTPLYMAPEQFRGQWRDYGPWTDLYALGCMAWEMCCGRPPFYGRKAHHLFQKHTSAPLPAFTPGIPVPEGFAGWLHRLLQKHPRDRFQRAADAAWALAQLPDPPEDLRTTSISITSNPTITLDETMLMAERAPAPTTFDPDRDFPDGLGPPPVVLPAVPPSWKRADLREEPMQLLGAGLGLYGLRSVPLVDRVHERDAIWDTLVDCIDTRQPRCLVLRGASGNGKSRLVEWMGQRAHEVGAVEVLKAVHSPTPGALDGLGPLVERHHQLTGLDRAEVEERVKHTFSADGIADPTTWLAVAELARPAPDDHAGDVVRFGSPEERYAVVVQLLRRATAERPALVWLDDVQWGTDAIAFVRFALEHDPGPVLFLLTAQEEALAETHEARAALEELTGQHGVGVVPVGALARADHLALIRALLGLEGELAQQLADRTGGNPLFTVQLVGDWVTRGILVPTRHGFVLQEDEEVTLPDDLHQVWSDRLARLLGDDDAARKALEIAAALGQDVATGEWLAICADAGASPPADLLERLLNGRLAARSGGAWSFTHGMLRESLQRIAQEAGRWPAHNRACADTLIRLGGSRARRGRHLLAAGAYSQAMSLLREAVAERLASDDMRDARALMADHDEAVRRLGLERTDPRLGEAWLLRGRVCFKLEDFDQAALDARRTATAAARHGWGDLRARALDLQGQVNKARGNLPRALGLLEEALKAHTQDARRASCHISLAHALILGGQTEPAREHIEAAYRTYLALEDRNGLGLCLRFRGDIDRLEGRWDEAAERFEQAAAHHRAAGNRGSEGTARHGVAEMNRLRGRLDEAERGYREVMAIEDARGQPGWIPRLNLGLCLIARERYPEARRGLSELLEVWKIQRKRGYVAAVHCALMPCAAAAGDWDAFDVHLEQGMLLLDASGMVDLDVAQCAERGGDVAAQEGEKERAGAAWNLAWDHWNRLGNQAAADALMARMIDAGVA